MKKFNCLLFSFIIYTTTIAQPLPDSVKSVYNAATTAYTKHECLHSYLELIRSDNSFNEKALALHQYFKKNNDPSSSDYVTITEIGNMSKTGNYVTALDKSIELVKKFHERKDDYGESLSLYKVAQALYYAGDIEQSHVYSLMQLPLAEKLQNDRELLLGYNAIATDYASMNKPDSGILYGYKALQYAFKSKIPGAPSVAYGTIAENYLAKKNFDSVIIVAQKGIASHNSSDISTITSIYGNLASAFLGKKVLDSAMYYAGITISLSKENNFNDQLQLGYDILYKCYNQKQNTDSAFKYYKLAVETKDELYSAQKANQIKAITQREEAVKQQASEEKAAFENKIKLYALLGVLFVIAIIAFTFYKNNRQKQKANIVLQEQKVKVENTLSELKSTQAQLIQSEKMASLGELTAGIAHEIQNPLNFVNNFSEVNKELLEELREEADKGNIDEVKAIANDVIGNEEKINHHGKRADAIVKGMLQHSRSSTSAKELTDINALADEYLRLSYHGLRAKDNAFNATINTDFDNSIGKINIIPQDIGRVLLNLYNNAFYAVNEKNKTGGNDYQPAVTVSTSRSLSSGEGRGEVIIKVADNGNGIPQNIVDKIFQPFFTTKPTGQGTGLGLSLSYDIITKEHGGTIAVQSQMGEYAEFRIILPTG